MTELVNTLAFWLSDRKNRRWHILAVFLTVAMMVFSLLVMSQGSAQSEATTHAQPQPGSVSFTIHTSKKVDHKPQVQVVTSTPPISIEPVSMSYDPENDAWERGDRTQSFPEFQDGLVQALSDRYGEGFARDLTYALLKNIRAGKGNEEGTQEAISVFLGKNSTPDQVQFIFKSVQKVLGDIADTKPAYPADRLTEPD